MQYLKAYIEMFPCQKYFSQEIVEKLKASDLIVVFGMSMAMCNVLSWLKQLRMEHVTVYDPLLEANPHISTFKGNRVIKLEEALNTLNSSYILTEFSEKMRELDIKAISSVNSHNLVVPVKASREVRLEASGLCNLRCMSCQCGNYDPKYFSFQGRSFMQPELCEKILDKLIVDYPDNMGVFYYIFGEPFLNPHLDELIILARQRGLSVCISTNFSFRMNLQDVLRAEPDILKISLSGYTENIYQHHHNGGIAAYVYKNLETLYKYLLENDSTTSVVVSYHIYKDNAGLELEKVRYICQKCGFIFAPVKAIYNNPLKRMGLHPFTDKDIQFLKDYYDEPDKQMAFAISNKNSHFPCRNIRDKIFLDYDGSVLLCELLHKDTVYKNYLEVSREEIFGWRTNHDICKTCRAHGMHLV